MQGSYLLLMVFMRSKCEKNSVTQHSFLVGHAEVHMFCHGYKDLPLLVPEYFGRLRKQEHMSVDACGPVDLAYWLGRLCPLTLF